MPGTRQPNCNLEKICVTRFARRTILDEERKSERKREGGREKEREAREQKYIKKRGLIKVQGKQRQEREREGGRGTSVGHRREEKKGGKREEEVEDSRRCGGDSNPLRGLLERRWRVFI